ncbi:cysteine-rich CWC family protein [Amphritea sp.]|uniref:cysteine-rich CWC family protein n=1 Tax=Amphritea sp. TaxID=1872502 RepID=UPI003566D695
MNTHPDSIDPAVCPLCKQSNQCGNISSCGSDTPCWCSSPEITFTESVLNQLSDDARGTACICKSCALANS